MKFSKLQSALAGVGIMAVVMVVAVAYYFGVYLASDHYRPGVGRIDSYALTAEPTLLTIYFTVGAQDIPADATVVEDARAVTVTARTSEFMPGTGHWKNLAGYGKETTVRLAEPLGQRVVVDGGNGRLVLSAPAATHSNRATCAKLVDDFFAACNAREAARVAGLFSADLSFHESVAGSARDLVGREDLQRYLAERFAIDDRFSSLTIDMPENPAPAAANPTVSFLRVASGSTYRGNAKLVCSRDRLIAVVMSAE